MARRLPQTGDDQDHIAPTRELLLAVAKVGELQRQEEQTFARERRENVAMHQRLVESGAQLSPDDLARLQRIPHENAARRAEQLEAKIEHGALEEIAEADELKRSRQIAGGHKGYKLNQLAQSIAKNNRVAVERAAKNQKSQRDTAKILSLNVKTVRKYWPKKT